MSFIREKLSRFSRFSKRDLNEMVRLLRRLNMITSGRGLSVSNLPPGIGISVNMGQLGLPGFGLARIVDKGPNGEEDCTEISATGAYWPWWTYWVREVVATGVVSPAFAEGGGKQPWPVPEGFEYKSEGFWEPAVNLAEVGLPEKCRHTAIQPIERAIPTDPETDDTPEGDVTEKEDVLYKEGPIVTTWKASVWAYPAGGMRNLRMFCLFMPRLTEEWILQTYDLDADGCPDPYQWKRRVMLRLHEEDGIP